jgi:2-oxoglutarate dehydrogenase E1 component
VEKPLVVMTPKSLLRLPRCQCALAELAEGAFHEVLADPAADPAGTRRIVLCTGKLYYDLQKAREDGKVEGATVVRLEQLFPFPAAQLSLVLQRYADDAELVWAQEEPRNMGAWRFVREEFLDRASGVASGRVPRYVGREASASPAPGSMKAHNEEQEAIVEATLRIPAAADTRAETRHAAPLTS